MAWRWHLPGLVTKKNEQNSNNQIQVCICERLLTFITGKQETILIVALRLFAERGFENTPTSQIAKKAGVSEGLIFRRFENKDGLLRVLITDGQARIQRLVDRIVHEPDPKKILAQTIDLPLTLISEEREFWTLQFILKYNSKYAAALKAESNYYGTLVGAVGQAFTTLGIARVIGADNPKIQYFVGADARMFFGLARALPISWRHGLLRGQFGG